MIYKILKNSLGEDECILAETDEGEFLFIPFNEANTDYQAYLAWVEENK